MSKKVCKIIAILIGVFLLSSAVFTACGNAEKNGSTNNKGVPDSNNAVNKESTTIKSESNSSTEKGKKVDVSIQTDKGEIVVELRPDLMPITVENFMKLVNSGFYNGLNFHRVENWVIQGGDPQGTGMGGPGWTIKLETTPELKNIKYAIAMARSQKPDSAGSQFYILKKDSAFLDGQYAVFGNVIKGQDVVDKIAKGDKIKEVKK